MSQSFSRFVRRHRRLIAVFAIVPLLAITSACSSGGGGSSTPNTDLLTVAMSSEPPTLEPCKSAQEGISFVDRTNITETLAAMNYVTGKVEPDLALSWKHVSPTEWDFTLRQGVKFSDGEKFDAAAAAYSINRSFNPTLTASIGCDATQSAFVDEVATASVIDANTLKVTTSEVDPILPTHISFLEIVAPSTSETVATRDPIGTGPYKLSKWDAGQDIMLVRNNNYWGKAPAYKAVKYIFRPEGSVEASMLKTGEIDIALGIGPKDGAGDLGVVHKALQMTGLRLDGRFAPLNDIRVREAINYSIDRTGLVNALWPGAAKPAGTMVPDGVAGSDTSLKPWPFDMAKAKSLVAAAKASGVPTDTQIKLVYKIGHFEGVADEVEILQKSMEEAGLNVKILAVSREEGTKYTVKPFVDGAGPVALISGHSNTGGDASLTVDPYMEQGGVWNTFGNATLDKLIQKASQAEGAARIADYKAAQDYERKDVVQMVAISQLDGLVGVGPKVSYKPNAGTTEVISLATVTPKK
jgi:peptide/nickel transport system substrate-binding protein